MEFKNNKILVTGTGGFIGSHLTEYLVEQGHKVKAFIRYNSCNFWGWLRKILKRKRQKRYEIVNYWWCRIYWLCNY